MEQTIIKKWKSNSFLLNKKSLKSLSIGMAPFLAIMFVFFTVSGGWSGLLLAWVIFLAAFLLFSWIDFTISAFPDSSGGSMLMTFAPFIAIPFVCLTILAGWWGFLIVLGVLITGLLVVLWLSFVVSIFN